MRTAAYFAVGLNEFLDEGPIQHREVRWYESQVLLKLSPNITYKLRSMQQQLDTNWDGKGVPPSRTPTAPAPALVTFKPVPHQPPPISRVDEGRHRRHDHTSVCGVRGRRDDGRAPGPGRSDSVQVEQRSDPARSLGRAGAAVAGPR